MVLVATALTTAVVPAYAQLTSATTTVLPGGSATSSPTARIIEWDLPAKADASPGAMLVDSDGRDRNRIWFVTRAGVPRVVVLDMPKSLMKNAARWTSWELREDSLFTGGLRKIRASNDRRWGFVRTFSSLQRIDTRNCGTNGCERTAWLDNIDGDPVAGDVSDVAIDDQNTIYTASAVLPNDPADASYIQALKPSPYPGGAAVVTRWVVSGGVGSCSQGVSFPCLSGIAVHPRNRNLVYYSEPFGNNIGELNVYTNKVRRWNLTGLPTTGTLVREPRQLHVDRWGKIWVVTGSGHLVSLDPSRNRLTTHQMPSIDASDPFGVAPDDDVVGYTASGTNRVGMVIPKGAAAYVTPSTQDVTPVGPLAFPGMSDPSPMLSGFVTPDGKTVKAEITKKTDGTFIEAQIDTPNDSQVPLGITPDHGRGQGTFFYAVALNSRNDTQHPEGADRVGFVRLPIREKIAHPRDDHDADDGWEGSKDWHGWHGHKTGDPEDDEDDDGVPNKHDTADDERMERSEPATIAPGSAADYSMTASSTTLALVAIAEASDPLAQIGIDILDANGILVARSAPTMGIATAQLALPLAGTYTCRIRNYGLSAVTHSLTTIVREPWIP